MLYLLTHYPATMFITGMAILAVEVYWIARSLYRTVTATKRDLHRPKIERIF